MNHFCLLIDITPVWKITSTITGCQIPGFCMREKENNTKWGNSSEHCFMWSWQELYLSVMACLQVWSVCGTLWPGEAGSETLHGENCPLSATQSQVYRGSHSKWAYCTCLPYYLQLCLLCWLSLSSQGLHGLWGSLKVWGKWESLRLRCSLTLTGRLVVCVGGTLCIFKRKCAMGAFTPRA